MPAGVGVVAAVVLHSAYTFSRNFANSFRDHFPSSARPKRWMPTTLDILLPAPSVLGQAVLSACFTGLLRGFAGSPIRRVICLQKQAT